MRFLNKHYRANPQDVVSKLLDASSRPSEGDWHIAPGFGTRFGGIDIIPNNLAKTLEAMPGETPVLHWGKRFCALLEEQSGCGWLTTGVARSLFGLRHSSTVRCGTLSVGMRTGPSRPWTRDVQ